MRSSSTGGLALRSFEPLGPDRDRVIGQIRQHFEALAAEVPQLLDQVSAVVAAHEPTELLASVGLRTSTRFFSAAESLADDPDTSSWPAKVEFLVGVALAHPAGSGSTPTSVTDGLLDLVDQVFDGVHAEQMLAAFDTPSTGDSALDETLFMLKLEGLTDRMPGYPLHLERVDAEVFDRHRDFYVQELGFNPADVNRLVRRYLAHLQRRTDAAVQRVREVGRSDAPGAARALSDLISATTDSRRWRPEPLAEATALPSAEVQALLDFFSTQYGAQPDFRHPLDRNLARTHPVIKLGNEDYFVPDAWSLSAAVHGRMHKLADDGLGKLQARYLKHRDDGHGRLTAEAFRRAFGYATHANQHYLSSAGAGEIDVLVSSSWPLLIEAKAQTLTDAGRRGAPARVEKVAGSLIERALEQTSRAGTYILGENGRSFSSKEGGAVQQLLPDQVEQLTEVIVTFERMDPLTMLGPAVVDSASRPIWMVSIADLLMVTDVLGDAMNLHHYTRSRAHLNAAGLRTYVESDALGAYLRDRLEDLQRQVTSEPDKLVMLGYDSDSINDFFTGIELGRASAPPRHDVPDSVLNAMRHEANLASPDWVACSDLCASASADAWRRWKRFRRRHRGGGDFRLVPGLVLQLAEPASITRDGDVLRLTVPDVP